ncbi:hypothetical protein SO802_021298 [Lithocarpus litseifolius]|uniref:Uncharacterized protein n=1 Tax=Lithocarpus litseifolius TaxID=425828 RepID=A0AAW2CEV9_9ROSI
MAENGVAITSDENDAPTSVSDASNSSTFDEEIVINEEENEQKLEIEKIEEKKHEINKILDENEIVLEPKVGMMLNLEAEVRAYHTQYAKQAGGFEKLPFGGKDCRNHVDKVRRLQLGVGGARALRDYFVRMQEKDDRFYYVIDVDDRSRLWNVF